MARTVNAPEAVMWLFGYDMKKGELVHHLTTLPPSRRRRSRPNKSGTCAPEDEEDASDVEDDTPLRFHDGDVEKYQHRPANMPTQIQRKWQSMGKPDAADTTDWEAMLYPTFHRLYTVVTLKDVQKWSQKKLDETCKWRCSNAGTAYLHGDRYDMRDFTFKEYLNELPADTKFVVKKPESRPVWWDWRLPSRHGVLYYYQLLMLRVPFRNSAPAAFIQSHVRNPSGSLREECIVRGMVDPNDETAQVRRTYTKTTGPSYRTLMLHLEM